MAKFRKNDFVIYKGKFAKVKEVLVLREFLNEVVYKIQIWELNQNIYVFENEISVFKFKD